MGRRLFGLRAQFFLQAMFVLALFLFFSRSGSVAVSPAVLRVPSWPAAAV